MDVQRYYYFFLYLYNHITYIFLYQNFISNIFSLKWFLQLQMAYTHAFVSTNIQNYTEL